MNEVRCPNCAAVFAVGDDTTTLELARIAERAGASAFCQTVNCPSCGVQVETRPGADPQAEKPRENATAGMTAQEIYDLGYPGDFGSSAWDDDDPNWPPDGAAPQGALPPEAELSTAPPTPEPPLPGPPAPERPEHSATYKDYSAIRASGSPTAVRSRARLRP